MIPYDFDLEHFFRPTLRFFTIPRFVRTDRQTDRQGQSNSPPFALQAGKGWTKTIHQKEITSGLVDNVRVLYKFAKFQLAIFRGSAPAYT
jgi:hypothetical protein